PIRHAFLFEPRTFRLRHWKPVGWGSQIRLLAEFARQRSHRIAGVGSRTQVTPLARPLRFLLLGYPSAPTRGVPMPNVVYILTNPAMPGLVKIGRTSDGVGVETRLRQLDTTCLPLPFECFYAVEVEDAQKVERALHDAFDDHRIRSNREFFRLSPDRP